MGERNKSKHLLGDVLFPNPERGISDPEISLEQIAAQEGSFLRVGPIAHFIYDFSSDRFKEMDDSVVDITGITRDVFLSESPGETIASLVEQSHSEALPLLIRHSFDLLEKFASERKDSNLIANIEHNIITRQGISKRIIVQYIPIVKDISGKPYINKGCIVDITHIRNDGLPQLFILQDNRIIESITASIDSIMKNGDIPLSKIELRIVQLISEGLLAKEVAREMNISISTLYTHRKNIKSKTGYDINKLISILKEKGLLVQTGAIHALDVLIEMNPGLIFA